MNIEIERLAELIQKSDKIFFTPEGEEVLVRLLEVQKQVEEAIKEAKAKLEKTALSLDPNFSSIQSDRVKVYYRAYGSRWGVDEANVDRLPKEMYRVKTSYMVETKEVERYFKEKGVLPLGITEYERPKSISFSLKGSESDNDQVQG